VTNLLEYLKILLKRWLTDLQNTGSIGKLEDAWLGLATNSTLKHSLQALDTENCCRWIIHRRREGKQCNIGQLTNPKVGILGDISLTEP
jgi:hypothetical protein